MKKTMLALAIAACSALPSEAATVNKTYSYFSVGGTTLDEIVNQLSSRGPQVKSTGLRHPGATRMQFTTKLGYAESKAGCQILKASVSVSAKVILPRWSKRAKADGDVRLIWDTLSADIKRHEESHVGIAKNHARDLEQALLAIGRQKTCKIAADKAKATSAAILARHDAAQDKFDQIERINFEDRIRALLRYRMERIETGKLPG